jgi:hypothetical protein
LPAGIGWRRPQGFGYSKNRNGSAPPRVTSEQIVRDGQSSELYPTVQYTLILIGMH